MFASRKFDWKSFVGKTNLIIFDFAHEITSIGIYFDGWIISVFPKKNPGHFIKPLRARKHDAALFSSVLRVEFRWKLSLPAARAAYRDGFTWPLISIVDRYHTHERERPNSHVIHHTHRNSCPTTVHPLRRLLSFRRNASATLSLSILSCSNAMNFSRPFLKRTHFAGGDGRVTVVSRHNDTQSRVKSDTRTCPSSKIVAH